MPDKKHRQIDEKGNYAIDGVSYDGDDVHIAGDDTDTNDLKEQFPQEYDRKKNLNFTDRNTTKAEEERIGNKQDQP